MVAWTHVAAGVAGFAGIVNAAMDSDWRARAVYQTMTDRFGAPNGNDKTPCVTSQNKYCGGTYKAMIDHLDYIQGMGFSAVQISPIVENLPQDTAEGYAYHGYWPQNMYALNDNFGTEDDLKQLVQELHNRGMFLMVDVTINDLGYAINGNQTNSTVIDYSVFNPFNDESYFHPFCPVTNWNSPEDYQNCWIYTEDVTLPDLNTQNKTVQGMLDTWVHQMISNYSVDGIRIDAAKHVTPEYLPNFLGSAGVYASGEVYSGAASDLCEYQQKGWLTGMPNYAVYFNAQRGFTDGNMSAIPDMVDQMKACAKDVSVMGVFMENHDVPRIASYTNDTNLLKNVMAWNILADGIPTGEFC